MGLKDDVRQRRHQKIKSLLERYSDNGERPGGGRGTTAHSLPEEWEAAEEGGFAGGPQAGAAASSRHERRGEQASMPNEPASSGPPNEPGSRPAGDRHEPRGKQTMGRKQAAQRSPSAGSDPELAWKRNPNPWVVWDEEGQGTERAYAKARNVGPDEYEPPVGGLRSFLNELKWKTVIAAALFGLVWAIHQFDNEWTLKGRAIIAEAMADEFDFAAVAVWYRDTFAGAPSFIPMFQDNSSQAASTTGETKPAVVAPIEDATLVRTFAELLNGVELAGPSEAPVAAVETGRVIVVTEEGDSVLIQHANGRITVYGKLGAANVAVNDWVEAGDWIGKLRPAGENGSSLLYFAVKQNDHYIDPLGVIPVD